MTKTRQWLALRQRVCRLCPAMLLAACAAQPGGPVDPQSGFISQLPPKVIELADPSQDLTAVQLNPEDNCYWYRYDGPVETTMLPLRTREGRPICLARKEG